MTPDKRNTALAKSHKMNKGVSEQFDLRLRESKTSDISASPPRAKSSLDGRSKSAQRIPFGTIKNVSFKADAFMSIVSPDGTINIDEIHQERLSWQKTVMERCTYLP